MNAIVFAMATGAVEMGEKRRHAGYVYKSHRDSKRSPMVRLQSRTNCVITKDSYRAGLIRISHLSPSKRSGESGTPKIAVGVCRSGFYKKRGSVSSRASRADKASASFSHRHVALVSDPPASRCPS